MDIAARNQNLFVSAETFANIDNEGINMLHSYLSHWEEVVIVVYYRRLFDCLGSQYRHLHDVGKSSDTIIEYFQNFLKKNFTDYTKIVSLHFKTVGLLQRKFENVVIMNYHDKSFRGSGESFYCNALPNATHMCDAIKSQETKRDNARSARQIVLQDLIHYAMDFKESDRSTARNIAQKYHKETKIWPCERDVWVKMKKRSFWK